MFVYRRQDEVATFAEVPEVPEVPPPASKPVIHISQPAAENSTLQRRKRKHTLGGETKDVSANDPLKFPRGADSGALDVPEQRRFHLSRPDSTLDDSPYPSRSNVGVAKKRPSSFAMFVERRIKKASPKTLEKLHAARESLSPPSTPSTPSTGHSSPTTDNEIGESKKLKKPGVSARMKRNNAPKDNSRPPPPADANMEKMMELMNAFVIDQIGLKLQELEEEKNQTTSPQKSPAPLRFKPKAPAQRYSERHPETVSEPVDKEMEDVDTSASDTDDEYVIETYVRVPASRMGSSVSPQDVGLLVFDEEPDIDSFYNNGSDSEDEWLEDEDDENGKTDVNSPACTFPLTNRTAENYYAADYPDEEVHSDDEFGRNAYDFRTGNASDLEEFGSDDDYDTLSYSSDGGHGDFKATINRKKVATDYL